MRRYTTGVWRRYRSRSLWTQIGTAVLGLALLGAVLPGERPKAAAGQGPIEDQLPRAPTVPTTPRTSTTSTTSPTTTTVLASTTIPPSTAAPTTAAPVTPVTSVSRPAITTTTRAVRAPAPSSCHPSYEGACLPPDASDVDCAGGSGNGPVYAKETNIRLVGPDVFDLDRDGDGLGCEPR